MLTTDGWLWWTCSKQQEASIIHCARAPCSKLCKVSTFLWLLSCVGAYLPQALPADCLPALTTCTHLQLGLQQSQGFCLSDQQGCWLQTQQSAGALKQQERAVEYAVRAAPRDSSLGPAPLASASLPSPARAGQCPWLWLHLAPVTPPFCLGHGGWERGSHDELVNDNTCQGAGVSESTL